ncbi:hypothetical protein TRFO_18174 [Tritrichomonas foetus]|uniref:Uncharacterized protein n=1 Tax=Tritrichomonas foetus TaxID=1144522 RepID=A0A1J4KQU9_9EUKA|nr:hypothetical protein TRFO_18174 [Tritrichomonas foetus]|eukprot:OHT12172.1 hypothetical protein TRFO_18174 [Tritrichomonas foetus]
MSDFSDTIPISDEFESDIRGISESCDISSIDLADRQFSDLQNDILEQGKAIEAFIKLHSAKKRVSETFRVLQALFILFKSTLSMNINLRQTLIKNRCQYSQEADDAKKARKNVSDFLIGVSKISNKSFKSLFDVAKYMKQSIQINEHTSKIEKENQKYMIQVQQLKSQIMDFEAQKEVDLAHLRNRAETAETNSIDLQNQIKMIQQNNFKLEKTISQIEAGKFELIQKYQKQNLEESQAASMKLKNANKKLIQARKEIEQIQSENESLKNTLNQSEKEKTQLLFEVEKLKQSKIESNLKRQEIFNAMTEMQQKLSSIEANHTGMTSQIENEAITLRNENKKLSSENKKLIKNYKSAMKKNHSLVNENSQFIGAIDKLNNEIDEMRQFLEISDNIHDEEYQMKDIIQAFYDLRDGLGLKKQWNPKKVAKHILRKMRKLEHNFYRINERAERNFNDYKPDINMNVNLNDQIGESSTTDNINYQMRKSQNNSISYSNVTTDYESPLREQIRSLQNEIDLLRNELA